LLTLSYRKELKNLIPYKPGKPIEDVKREYGLDKVIKLASNENPLGCSEKVKEAITHALNDLSIYPDGNATLLKESISKKYNIPVDEILPTSGSDEMIDLIAKTFIEKDDEAIMADITFPRYAATTNMMGGVPVIVPLKNYTHDLTAILKAITPKTKIIWICNPNNPTGTICSEEEVIDFLNKVPQNVVVAYDIAYGEYVERKDYPRNSIDFIKKYPNVMVMKTFSKAYGLAGLRVAYTIANKEIIENINKVRGPFNVNSLAQIAAVAALKDEEFLKKTYEVNIEGKKYLYQQFDDMKLSYPPSEANHIYVNIERDANETFIELQKRGIIIRPMGGTWIRVSIGTMEENRLFIKNLKDILNK